MGVKKSKIILVFTNIYLGTVVETSNICDIFYVMHLNVFTSYEPNLLCGSFYITDNIEFRMRKSPELTTFESTFCSELLTTHLLFNTSSRALDNKSRAWPRQDKTRDNFYQSIVFYF